MTSRQSTLGGESGIAQELAEGQRAISIAEFFEKNKHMLGFDSPGRSIVTAVKEAVDNALDATEEAGILPHVSVDITESGDYYKLVIEDNGPGVTKEQVPKVFGKLLYGSRFHAREQSRGQQGIGISAAVLYSQLTSGKPAKITSKTEARDQAQYFELVIDTDTNEPEIRVNEETDFDATHGDDHGTRIELEMEANMRARQQLHNYIEYTAVVNPHATVRLDEPGLDDPIHFERATDEMPEETKEILPHPHGVELGTLQKMLDDTDSHSLSGFLQSEFTRVGAKSAQNILDEFKDRHYGRELAVPVPADDTDAIEDAVHDSVRNKGYDATEGFVDELIGNLQDAELVARSDVNEAVHTAAEDATDTFGKTFGSTVRENATAAAWGILNERCCDHLEANVDAATSARKTDEVVAAIADHICQKLRAHTGDDLRLTRDTLDDFVTSAAAHVESEYDTAVGDTARTNITDAIWDLTRTVPDDVPLVREVSGNRNMEQHLLEAMAATKLMAPPTDCLSPISAELLEEGMKKVYNADFYAASTRDADVHAGEPFIAEAGIAYGGDLEVGGKSELLRFANRVPLVYQEGACGMTDTVKSIGWRNYKVSQSGGHGLPDEPMVIVVHVASTNVPFTSESKDALASVEAIEDELELAVREAARELKSYLTQKADLEQRKKKQNVIADLLPDMAEKAAQVSGAGEPADVTRSLARIMNSVLLRPDDEELSIENYANGSESLEVRVKFNGTKPTYPSQNTERVETDDGWELVWEGSLDDGDADTITWNADADPVDIEAEDISEAKVSYTTTDFGDN